jgi:hypothetical protein
MTEVQLQQKIDIQLDPDTDVLTRITGYDLRDALKRTTHLAKEDDIILLRKVNVDRHHERPRDLENVSFE